MMPAPTQLVSHNPADGTVLGTVAVADAVAVQAAIAAARAALPAWRELGASGRARHLRRLATELARSRHELATTLSHENGKPLGDAMAEVFSAAEFLSYYARHAGHMLADEPTQVLNPLLRNHKTYLTYEPKGVVGVISPWNYPLLLAMASITGALAAGNVVVHKPSEWTPLVALALQAAVRRAGLPAGVLEVVCGDGRTGAALVAGPVDHVCFTGSVATGRLVAAHCAERLITCTLELGGKDPALVLEPFDLEFTAQGVVWAAFTNTGQACASIERLYVPRARAAELTERIVARVRALRVGPGDRPTSQVGPLVNAQQLAKVAAQVEDAVARGARVLTGGKVLPGPGFWYAPTVLVDVTSDMLLLQEETFGPVLPILPYDDLAEAVRSANDSPFGLSATVWSSDLTRAEAIARRLETGSVWVNGGLDSYGNPATPRGGFKESGLGRVGGRRGLMDLVEPRLIDINRAGRTRLTWHVGSGRYEAFMEGGLRALHGDTVGERLAGAAQLLRNWLPRIL